MVIWTSLKPSRFIIFHIMVFCTALVGGILGFWAADHNKAIIITNISVPEKVIPGEKVIVTYKTIQTKICEYDVQYYIFDGQNQEYSFPIQNNISTFNHLNPDEHVLEFLAPKTLKYGDGEFKLLIRQYCNPFHKLSPIVTYAPEKDINISA